MPKKLINSYTKKKNGLKKNNNNTFSSKFIHNFNYFFKDKCKNNT